MKTKDNLHRFHFEDGVKYCSKCKHSKTSRYNPIARVDCTIYNYKALWWYQEAICLLNPDLKEKYEED